MTTPERASRGAAPPGRPKSRSTVGARALHCSNSRRGARARPGGVSRGVAGGAQRRRGAEYARRTLCAISSSAARCAAAASSLAGGPSLLSRAASACTSASVGADARSADMSVGAVARGSDSGGGSGGSMDATWRVSARAEGFLARAAQRRRGTHRRT